MDEGGKRVPIHLVARGSLKVVVVRAAMSHGDLIDIGENRHGLLVVFVDRRATLGVRVVSGPNWLQTSIAFGACTISYLAEAVETIRHAAVSSKCRLQIGYIRSNGLKWCYALIGR